MSESNPNLGHWQVGLDPLTERLRIWHYHPEHRHEWLQANLVHMECSQCHESIPQPIYDAWLLAGGKQHLQLHAQRLASSLDK